MKRFYLFYLLSSFYFFGQSQGYNFYSIAGAGLSNDCRNGGATKSNSVQVTGLDILSNDLELMFAGADFTPTNSFDLSITLISPNGTRATLLDTRAGSGHQPVLGKYNIFRFRSCGWFKPHTAPNSIPYQTNSKLFTSQPVTDFSIFKGENPNGEWKFEFCSKSGADLSGAWVMLEFRTLKAIIPTPTILKKPADCASADGQVEFLFGTKCDQGSVYYTIDNQPWQSKSIPVDYTLGFIGQIKNTINGLKAGKHTIKAALGDANGNIYTNTYNEKEFYLEAITANGDIQISCGADLTIGTGTSGSVDVKLIPPFHWDNCGFPTSITKITGKFGNGDINVDINTQKIGINGNGKTEFVWEVTNSKGQKKTCSNFVTTVAGNVAVFTADVCKSPVKVQKCDYSKPLQYIPIHISQLQNLGTKNTLDKVEVTMKFPSTCTGEAFLLDPAGNSYYLFNAFSFPSYNNSGSMTVEFSASQDPSIKSHLSATLPSGSDKLRRPISNLNFANFRKINPNGTWNLAVCDNLSSGFDIECVKFHFNDACTIDQERPTFTQCPANRIVTLGANNQASFNITEPFSTDNCKVKERKLEITYLDGAKDAQGQTNFTYNGIDADQGKSYPYDVVGKGRVIFKYTTIDEANNEGYCYVYIYVVGPNDCATDQTKPILVNCVQDFEISAYPSGVTDFWTTDPGYYDNCGIKSVQQNISFLNGAKSIKNTTFETINSISPNQIFTYQVVGTGLVQLDYLVTDLKGNVGSCRTNVTVKPSSSNPTDPCANLSPTISSANNNCVNSEISIPLISAPNAVRIDWKNGSQTVQTLVRPTNATSSGTTVAGTGTAGTSTTQFNSPIDVELDQLGNMYVSDNQNNRVMKFAPGSTTGIVLPPKNATATGGIQVDKAGNIYLNSGSGNVVTKWSPGATTGIVVAGGNGAGSNANQLNSPSNFYVDANDNIYVADRLNYRIQKWSPGATSGVTVAGTGVKGNGLNQLDTISNVFVNELGEIFVAESIKGIVKKFPANSTQGTNGVIVANVNGIIRQIKLDAAGNIYASGFDNNTDFIKKFPYNSTATTPGVIVAGGNSRGAGANQLYDPNGFSFDENGSIYIAEYANHRISKWIQTNGNLSLSYIPTVAGTYTADVTFSNGCKKTTNSLSIVNCNQQNALQFNIANGCITPGQSGTFPLTVNNFNGIGAFSFDLVLPANSNLSFDKVDNLGLNNITFNVLNNGDLRVVWDEPNGGNINLADGTRICDIIIKSTAAFAQPAVVTSREIVLLSNNTVTTAVVSTFTVCASSKITVSGTIKNPAGKPISKVKLGEYNPATQTFVSNVESDANGAFSFGQVTPTNQITAGRNDDPSLGVNIADVARIRRHILQTSLLDSDYKKMAADVDLNGKLDVVDVAITNRIVLKKISVFPNNESWRCVPADYNISANPLDVKIPWWIDLSKPGLNTSNLNFVAVKVGDVDFSASVADEHLENRLAPVTLSIPDTIIAPNSNMVVPVYIGGGDNISIFSANLAYDTTKLKLVKIESSMMQGFGSGSYNDLGGNVIIAWDHPQGGEFVGNGTLMRLTFSNKVMTGSSPLTLSNVNAYDINFNQYTTNLDDGSLTMTPSGTNDNSAISEVRTYPNPFSDVLNMEVSLVRADKLTLEIFDVLGHLIKKIDTDKISDQHFLQINDLDYKGVLQCKISTSDATFTTKVIKI